MQLYDKSIFTINMSHIIYRYILFVILAISAYSAQAQIVKTSDNNFNEDSVRNEFDRGSYFSLYKDNYFIAGTTLGSRPSTTNSDIKFQVSIAQRLTKSTLPFNSYFFIFYNQKVFWNVFENSMPVHDFNFNPGVGFSKLLIAKDRIVGKASLLLEHESNGKDSIYSRSWNRISLCGSFYISPQFMIHAKYWIPIIDGKHNKDILKYCGIYQNGIQVMSRDKRYGMAVTVVKRKGWNMNVNTIIELNFRMFKQENQYLFLQYYNGYGESLIDYNQYHSRIRLGFVIKPKWFSEY